MKKISIEVSEDVHAELLKLQLDRRLKEGDKKPLAQIVSDFLESQLIETKKPAK